MNKKIALIVGAGLLIIAGTAYALNSPYGRFTKWLMVGTWTKQAMVTFQGTTASDEVVVIRGADGQTEDLIDFQNSSGATLAKIAADGDITAVDGTFSGSVSMAATAFSGQVTINDNLYVNHDDSVTDEIAFVVDGSSGAVYDIMAIRTYDGTEKLDVSAAGHTGVKGNLAVTGTSTLTGAVSVVTSIAHTTGNIGLKIYSADPCGSIGANKGPWINNATPSKMCFCDSATDDMIVDGSTDCF
jgi:hypothetical protein